MAKETFNDFIKNYSGGTYEVLCLQKVFTPEPLPILEKNLTLKYGRDASVAWAEFLTFLVKQSYTAEKK